MLRYGTVLGALAVAGLTLTAAGCYQSDTTAAPAQAQPAPVSKGGSEEQEHGVVEMDDRHLRRGTAGRGAGAAGCARA